MTMTHRHGEVIAVLHRKVIEQGNSRMLSLTPFLDEAQEVTIYILKKNERYVSIEIDLKPMGA